MNTKETPPQKSDINIGNIEGLVNVSEVHFNVSQEIIVATEDKIRLSLTEHLKKMEKKQGWLAPLGILITTIITLTTSSFKDIGINASGWQAIFTIAGVGSLGWLIYAVREALHSEKMEDIIAELKKDYRTKKNP